MHSETAGDTPPTRRHVHPHRAFWIVAATLVVVLFSSAAPAPLYPVYQELWGFSSLTLTLVFAVYVVTMLISLLTVGSLSDHIGRRPVLAVALVLLIGSMILFVVADGVPTLMAARALQGLATGAAIGTLTATVIDMQPTPRLGSAISGAAPAVGLATGVAIAGVLVEYAPWPRFLIYEVILGAFALLLIALLIVPETSGRSGFRSRRHAVGVLAPRAAIPRDMRPVFLAAIPAFVATWSLGGLYLSLGSSVVASVFGVGNHALAGLILFVFFGSAAVTSPTIAAMSPAAKLRYGYPALALGAVVSLGGVVAESLPVYVIGSIAAGSGFAATFVGALDSVSDAAPAAERGQVFSAVFVTCYLAFSVPAVVAGVLVSHIGLHATVIGYVAYVLVLAVVGLLLTRRRTAPAGASTTVIDDQSTQTTVSDVCMSAQTREE